MGNGGTEQVLSTTLRDTQLGFTPLSSMAPARLVVCNRTRHVAPEQVGVGLWDVWCWTKPYRLHLPSGAALLWNSHTQWAPLCSFQKGTSYKTPSRQLIMKDTSCGAAHHKKPPFCALSGLMLDQRVPPLGTHDTKVLLPLMSPGFPGPPCHSPSSPPEDWTFLKHKSEQVSPLLKVLQELSIAVRVKLGPDRCLSNHMDLGLSLAASCSLRTTFCLLNIPWPFSWFCYLVQGVCLPMTPDPPCMWLGLLILAMGVCCFCKTTDV